MADTTYKITFYYSQASFGWSESWWKTTATYDALAGPIQTYTQLRAGMLSQRVSLLAVRVSEAKKTRTGRLYLPGSIVRISDFGPAMELPGSGSQADVFGSNSAITFDQVRACLRYELLLDRQRLAYRYLCGIPDQVSLTEPVVTNYGEPVAWWNAFKAWRQFVYTNFLIHVSRDYSDAEDKPIIKWSTIDPAGGNVTLKLAATTPLVVVQGDKVVVTGVRMKAPGIRTTNGTWVVESITGGGANPTVIELRDSDTRAIEKIKSLGKVRSLKDRFQNITFLSPFKVGIHKRGRPFGVLLGRRKTQNYSS